MKLRTIFTRLMFLSLVFMLAACGGGDDDGDGDSGGNDGGGDNQSAGVDLPQTFTAETEESLTSGRMNVTLTFNYPEGWVMAYNDDQIMVANSQAILDLMLSGATDVTLSEGQVGGILYFAETAEDAGMAGDTVAENASPAEMVAALQESYATAVAESNGEAPEGSLFTGEVTTDTFTVNDKDGASISGQSSSPDLVADVVVIVFRIENGYVTGYFVAAEGQLEQFQDELRAITASGVAVITPLGP